MDSNAGVASTIFLDRTFRASPWSPPTTDVLKHTYPVVSGQNLAVKFRNVWCWTLSWSVFGVSCLQINSHPPLVCFTSKQPQHRIHILLRENALLWWRSVSVYLCRTIQDDIKSLYLNFWEWLTFLTAIDKLEATTSLQSFDTFFRSGDYRN